MLSWSKSSRTSKTIELSLIVDKTEYTKRGVGVVRDYELKLEEVNVSHTLGVPGEGDT